jgi:hypothetical protein
MKEPPQSKCEAAWYLWWMGSHISNAAKDVSRKLNRNERAEMRHAGKQLKLLAARLKKAKQGKARYLFGPGTDAGNSLNVLRRPP